MEKSLRAILNTFSMLVFWAAGIISLIINLFLLLADFGGGAVIIALILGPITDVIVPWYAIIVHGNWFPLLVGYGGVLVAIVLHFIAGDSEKE